MKETKPKKNRTRGRTTRKPDSLAFLSVILVTSWDNWVSWLWNTRLCHSHQVFQGTTIWIDLIAFVCVFFHWDVPWSTSQAVARRHRVCLVYCVSAVERSSLRFDVRKCNPWKGVVPFKGFYSKTDRHWRICSRSVIQILFRMRSYVKFFFFSFWQRPYFPY